MLQQYVQEEKYTEVVYYGGGSKCYRLQLSSLLFSGAENYNDDNDKNDGDNGSQVTPEDNRIDN